MDSDVRALLDQVHHELTTLHGLVAFDGADRDNPIVIDELALLDAIDAALDADMRAETGRA